MPALVYPLPSLDTSIDMQAQLGVATKATVQKLIAKIPPPNFSHSAHRARCLAQLRSKNNGLEKYIYLNGLKERDPTMFYTIVYDNMKVRLSFRVLCSPLIDLDL